MATQETLRTQNNKTIFSNTPNNIYLCLLVNTLIRKPTWPNKETLQAYTTICLFFSHFPFAVYKLNFVKLQSSFLIAGIAPAVKGGRETRKLRLTLINRLAYKYFRSWPALNKRYKKKYRKPRNTTVFKVIIAQYVWKLAKAQKTSRLNFFSYMYNCNTANSKVYAQTERLMFAAKAAYWPSTQKNNLEWFRYNQKIRHSYQKTRATCNLLGDLFKTSEPFATSNCSKSFSTLYNFFYSKETLNKNKKSVAEKIQPAKRALSAPVHSFRRRVQFLQRPVINLLWKSQDYWKKTFSRKRRWTTRKFFHIFTKWYKGVNKHLPPKKTGIALWWVLVRLGLFLSPFDYLLACAAGLVLHNKLKPKALLNVLKVGDIVTVSPNFATFPSYLTRVRLRRLRLSKKNAYVWFKNKTLWWKSKKKKFPIDALTNFWLLRSIPSWLEFDPGAAALAVVKQPRGHSGFIGVRNRSNLDKLNTFKLNV